MVHLSAMQQTLAQGGGEAAKSIENTLWKKGPDWLINGKPPKTLEYLATDEAEKECVKRAVRTNLVHEEHNQLEKEKAIQSNCLCHMIHN